MDFVSHHHNTRSASTGRNLRGPPGKPGGGANPAKEPVISILNWVVTLERAYAVLLRVALHDPQILVVHLQGSHQVEIRGNLLAALVLPLPQPVHPIQQAILFQLVYLYPVPQLTWVVHLQHLLARLFLILPMGLREEGRRLNRRLYGCREQ